MTLACPICGAPTDRNDKLVRGHVVLRCKACKTYVLEGDTFRVRFNSDGLKLIQQRADDLDQQKRYQEMVDSMIEDPRWTKVEL